MKKFVMRYPGDPPLPVEELTRAEFLERFPRGPVRITAGSEVIEIPVDADEVICDWCNQDPSDVVVVYGDGLRGYCKPCAERQWYPYCQEVT